MAVLLLGEVLVDLVCERPVTGLEAADAFVPHFGGAPANAAVVAARHGGAVALAGGAGDDGWGRWLRERLAAEGVGLEAFALVPGAATPVAFVTADATGEPSFAIYGGSLADVVAGARERALAALAGAEAFVFSSNTLLGEDERAATLAARARALELGVPVVFDPNLRLERWADRDEAVRVARDGVQGTFLWKGNRAEACLLTGEEEPEAAAEALLTAGARNALVTLGARGGALLRGEVRADAPGVTAAVVRNATGAGDAVLGVVLARLQQSGFYPPAMAAALPEALTEAARTVGRWGAVS